MTIAFAETPLFSNGGAQLNNSLHDSPQKSNDCPAPSWAKLLSWMVAPNQPRSMVVTCNRRYTDPKACWPYWAEWWVLAPIGIAGLKDFSGFCITRGLFIAQVSRAAIKPAVIYRAEYNVVWAELKLTNTGDVAIPLVKICLPGEKKRQDGRKKHLFKCLPFQLSCFYYYHVVG